MRLLCRAALAVIVYTFVMMPACALAGGPALATFGTSWDGPANDLQHIVDAYIGVPGALNVQTDYVGAHDGDVDWVGKSVPALILTEIAGNADTNQLGWYLEDGLPPRLDGAGHRQSADSGQGGFCPADQATGCGFHENQRVLSEGDLSSEG